MEADEDRIRLAHMQQLVDAIDFDQDDWTGLADSAERRKRQNRLHQRAWRRRKALKTQGPGNQWSSPDDRNPTAHQSMCTSLIDTYHPQGELHSFLYPSSTSIISAFTCSTLSRSPTHQAQRPLIPYLDPSNRRPPNTLIFPLPADHLLTLVQYNVLRATLTNMTILSLLHHMPDECGAALTSVPSLPYIPGDIPPSLSPTALQSTTPHEFWIDMIPHPQMRDNLILSHGKYDHDDLCCDLVGGLYDGFNDLELRGMMVWSDPWHPNGWEVTEGFARKWGFLLKGCGEMIEASNRWRAMRDEDRLCVEV